MGNPQTTRLSPTIQVVFRKLGNRPHCWKQCPYSLPNMQEKQTTLQESCDPSCSGQRKTDSMAASLEVPCLKVSGWGSSFCIYLFYFIWSLFTFVLHFFFYFYPKSPCYIFCHFQFGDFSGIPECANDWVFLGHHQMTSCGSQWELGLHPHQHQMSVFSNFHILAHI